MSSSVFAEQEATAADFFRLIGRIEQALGITAAELGEDLPAPSAPVTTACLK